MHLTIAECRKDHFSQTVGRTLSNAAQGTFSYLCHDQAFLAYGLKVVWSLLEPEGIPPHVQDFAFAFVGFHEAPVSSFLQPVEVPLNGNTTLWSMN